MNHNNAMNMPPVVSPQEWQAAWEQMLVKEKEHTRACYAPDVTTYPEAGGSYPERACVGCSMVADQVAHPAHLNARDTTLVFASRAPQAEIQGLKERMGWGDIPWYTITDDFDADFDVDQWHATNAFYRD